MRAGFRKETHGFASDVEMTARHWQEVVSQFKAIVEEDLGRPFPQDVQEQLWGAIAAVFESWESDRAKVYRRLNDIPGDWGTAVNVQAMVFGNMGETSATGVAFTRDPATGEKAYYGEWLVNAQGEDVVAGIRTPQYLTKAARERPGPSAPSMEEAMPEAYGELAHVFELLEQHYQRHAGHRVHRGTGQAVDAADPHAASAQPRPRSRWPSTWSGEGLIDERTAILPDRSDGARPAAAPHARSQSAARRAGQGPAGIAGRGVRARSCSMPIPPKARAELRRGGDPGARRDQPRGHSRHARRARAS